MHTRQGRWPGSLPVTWSGKPLAGLQFERDSTAEEGDDEEVESRDDEQGRDKHGKSTDKAPSVDLPASKFVCFSHFFT